MKQLISTLPQIVYPTSTSCPYNRHAVDDCVYLVVLQAAQYLTYAKRVSPANMRRLLKLTAYGVPVYTLAAQSRQFFKQHPLVFWAIVVLLLALFLKFLGWV